MVFIISGRRCVFIVLLLLASDWRRNLQQHVEEKSCVSSFSSFSMLTSASASVPVERVSAKLVHGLPPTPIPTASGARAPPVPARQPRAITGPDAFRKLRGKCFHATAGDYEYNICPFFNATQKQTSNSWNAFWGILGIWDAWNTTEDPDASASVVVTQETDGSNGWRVVMGEDLLPTSTSSPPPSSTSASASASDSSPTPTTSTGSATITFTAVPTVTTTAPATALPTATATPTRALIFTTQSYTDGTDCAGGKKRSTTLSFMCSGEGAGYAIKEIKEPATCEYALLLACPEACIADMKVGAESEPIPTAAPPTPTLTPTPTPTPTPTATTASTTTPTPTPTSTASIAAAAPSTPAAASSVSTPTTSPAVTAITVSATVIPSSPSSSSSSFSTTTTTTTTNLPTSSAAATGAANDSDALTTLQTQVKDLQQLAVKLSETVTILQAQQQTSSSSSCGAAAPSPTAAPTL